MICPNCNSSHLAIEGSVSTTGNRYRDLFFCKSCTHVFDALEASGAEKDAEKDRKTVQNPILMRKFSI
jgi:transposase-like protein